MPNMHFYFLSLTAPQFFILKVPHTSDSSKSMKLALRSGFRGWRPVTYSPGLADQSTPPPPSTAVIGLGMAMWSQSSLSALGILLGPLEKRGPPSAEWLSGYKVHRTHYWPPCSPHWETLPNNEAHTEERRAGRCRQTVGVLVPATSDRDSPEISHQFLESLRSLPRPTPPHLVQATCSFFVTFNLICTITFTKKGWSQVV